MQYLLLIAGIVFLQAGAGKAELAGEFSEQYIDRVEVSGGFVAGVTLDGPSVNPGLAPVIPYSASADNVCLSIISRDGRYRSRNSYVLSGEERVELPYPSRLQGKFDEIGTPLTALATAAPCDERYGDILPVLLGAGGEASRVHFAINASRDTVIFRSGDFSSQCLRQFDASVAGFDRVCTLEMEVIRQGGGEVRLERVRFGRTVASRTIRVAL